MARPENGLKVLSWDPRDPVLNRQMREAVQRNREVAEKVLERLGIIFELWPA